jgi:putative exosortase-associated protein (TIGR04073 family)
MQKKVVYFLSLIVVASFVAGCAGPEQKFGRGLSNMAEFARLGEMRRSFEQASIFESSGQGGTATGILHGINRSLERTGVGIYEVVTAPIPNHSHGDYGPIFFPADPVYPDSYKPDWVADTTLQPDTALGFAGGDLAPFIPGSRFRIFDN